MPTTDFQCAGCGECCRISGQVRLNEADIARLSAFLGLTEHEFIQRHTELARDRRGLILGGDPDLPCRFLREDRCAVYPARPEQCAAYPVAWSNREWQKICKPTRPRG